MTFDKLIKIDKIKQDSIKKFENALPIKIM